MPKAVINTEETHRHDLKSLPEGYVVLRRMPYGVWLKRQEMALRMKLGGGKKGEDFDGEMGMANRSVTEFEFSQCIVDHNLENADSVALDFRQSFTFDILDPRVGNEIARYILELHEFDTENLELGSGPQLS